MHKPISGNTVNDKLGESFVSLAANIERLSAAETIVVTGILKDLELDIVGKLQAHPDLTSWCKSRYNALLAQVKDQIASTHGKITDREQKVLAETAEATGKATAAIFEGVGVPLQSVIVSPEQWQALATKSLIQGAPSASWWKKQDQDLQDAFVRQMRIGYASGESIDQLIVRVRGTATGKRNKYEINGKEHTYVEFKGGIMETDTRHAAALVRTSIQQVSANAKMEMFKKNADILKGVMWLATLDMRTTQLCASRSGKMWTLDGEPIGHDLSFLGGVPAHFNCYVPGENLVSPVGHAIALYRRFYEGNIFVVRCSRVGSFSVTPEHEVFTLRGWVSAKDLKQGDYLIRQVFSDIGQKMPTIDIDDVKAGIHKQVHSVLFMRNPFLLEVPISSQDFNDGSPNSQISYILADYELFANRQTPFFEHISKQNFLISDVDLPIAAFGKHNLSNMLISLGRSTDSIIGSFGMGFLFINRHSGNMDSPLLMGCAKWDIQNIKPVANYTPVCAQCSGKLFGSEPRLILLQELLERNVVSMVGQSEACSGNDTFNSMMWEIEKRCQDFIITQEPIGQLDLGRIWLFGIDKFADILAQYRFCAMLSDSIRIAYFGKGKAIFVELDHLTDISVRHYSGHVENLACDSFNDQGGNITHNVLGDKEAPNVLVGNGCYFLNGLLVHNCRSTLVPVTKSFEELGGTPGITAEYLDSIGEGAQASMNGEVPADLTFDKWFHTLPEADQKAFLGKKKYEIWKKAGLNFQDMVDQRGNPLTIKQLSEAYGFKIKESVESGIPNIPKEMVSAIAVEQRAQLLASRMVQEVTEETIRQGKEAWDNIQEEVKLALGRDALDVEVRMKELALERSRNADDALLMATYDSQLAQLKSENSTIEKELQSMRDKDFTYATLEKQWLGKMQEYGREIPYWDMRQYKQELDAYMQAQNTNALETMIAQPKNTYDKVLQSNALEATNAQEYKGTLQGIRKLKAFEQEKEKLIQAEVRAQEKLDALLQEADYKAAYKALKTDGRLPILKTDILQALKDKFAQLDKEAELELVKISKAHPDSLEYKAYLRAESRHGEGASSYALLRAYRRSLHRMTRRAAQRYNEQNNNP